MSSFINGLFTHATKYHQNDKILLIYNVIILIRIIRLFKIITFICK